MTTARHACRRWLSIVLALLCLAGTAWGDFDNPKAKVPPRAAPQRRTGAEGVPPLPLPATPLRRTERKRQPAPPALVGMITLSSGQFTVVDGRRQEVAAFPTTQIDIERLMTYANAHLKIRYRYVPMSLESFSGDPAELPLLYLTGWTELPPLSDELVAKLHRYLMDGGTLLIQAQCGRQEFITSARREIARILPNRPLEALDSDSPLFHAAVEIDQMRVRKDAEDFRTMPPYLEAVYVGCRPAIIFSPVDLNCGWDVVHYPIQGGILYHQDDALKLGLNIIAVTLADLPYARSWGTETVYHQQDEPAGDRLVIGQIVHNGDWDPTPHGLANLMKRLQQDTTLAVQFKREVVDLTNADALRHPVLYMTGLRDFTLSEAAVARLRSYLTGGGVLVADAAAGSAAFDAAFRREMKRVLGDAELTVLPPDSPVYQTPYAITAVQYTPLVRAQAGNVTAPRLEGITVDGQLVVIYSPLSLSNGWEQLPYPYNRGYSDADALRLGVDILTYALTH
jgi:hypothetical protein